MNELPTSRLAALHRQQSEGYVTLRFSKDLEPEFRVERLAGVAPRRMLLLVASIALVAIIQLLYALMLHPPEAFVGPSRGAQFGFMIPALLLAAVFTAIRPLRPWSDLMSVVAAIAVCSGLLYQRHIGAALDFNVPSELIAVVLTGAAVMGGLRTSHFVGAVIVIVALTAWNEFETFGVTSRSNYVVLALGMLGLLVMLGAAIEEYAARGAWLQRKMLEELTLRDPLTGLVNARGLRDVYRRVFATSMREHRPMLVVAVDIDHFKAYNDHYGHLHGDGALKRFAGAVRSALLHADDVLARQGGEEFAVLLPGATLQQARVAAARIRERLREAG